MTRLRGTSQPLTPSPCICHLSVVYSRSEKEVKNRLFLFVNIIIYYVSILLEKIFHYTCYITYIYIVHIISIFNTTKSIPQMIILLLLSIQSYKIRFQEVSEV